MASIWKGSLAFGLVNIPVQLESAVRPTANVPFRQLDAKHHKPITLRRVSADGSEVPWRDVVKGFEIGKGSFVIVDKQDFAAAAVEKSQVIDLTDFVPADAIDPRFFETPYFLLPREGGDKAYALLREVLESTNKVGIGTFVLRERQHLVAVKPMDTALVLELMRYPNELVDPGKLTFPSAQSARVRPQEKTMAVQLIESMSGTFDPSRYKDDYHDKLRAIIKAKAKGKPLPAEKSAAREDTDVLDLVQRLKESIAANSRTRHSAPPAKRGRKTAKPAHRRKQA